MYLFSFFLLSGLFYVNCQGNHFGFATEEGDRVIVGEFLPSKCSKGFIKEIWELTCALNSTKFSYQHHYIYLNPSVLPKIKKSSKESIKRIYEVEPISIVNLIQKQHAYSFSDSSSLIFFEKPLLITTNREINESVIFYPTEIIIIDLMEEVKEPSPSEVNLSDDYWNNLNIESESNLTEDDHLHPHKLESKKSNICSIS